MNGFHSPYWRIACFVLLLFVPAAVGEVYVRSLPNPAKSKHEYLTKHSTEIETLILGSSHTYYGINPELLGNHAYSAALSSQTLRYDDYIFHAYPFPQLQTVILPISDFSFYEELEGTKSWFVANRYRLYMSCDIHPCYSVYNWEITSFRSFAEKLRTLWEPMRMKWSSRGQGLEYTLEQRPIYWDNGAERAQNNRYMDFRAATKIESYLDHIAQTAQDRNIRLLLLSTPLRPSYRSHQNDRQVEDTQRRIRRFCSTYSNIRYLNLTADSRFEASDFYDSDHLNVNGADKMTRIVADALEEK